MSLYFTKRLNLAILNNLHPMQSRKGILAVAFVLAIGPASVRGAEVRAGSDGAGTATETVAPAPELSTVKTLPPFALELPKPLPLPSIGAQSEPTTQTAGGDRLAGLRARFREVLWQRVRVPLFAFILLVVFLTVLALTIRRKQPTPWRSITARSVIISVMLHAGVLLVLNSFVLSKRIIQTVRAPEFEVLMQPDNLAEEKVGLGVREETQELPQASPRFAPIPQRSEAPMAGPTIVADAPPPAAPAQAAAEPLIRAEELPVPPTPADEPGKAPSEAARPDVEFRIAAPAETLETPKMTVPPPLEKETGIQPSAIAEKINIPGAPTGPSGPTRLELPAFKGATPFTTGIIETPRQIASAGRDGKGKGKAQEGEGPGAAAGEGSSPAAVPLAGAAPFGAPRAKFETGSGGASAEGGLAGRPDGLAEGNPYILRGAVGPKGLDLGKLGGTTETQVAVEKALKWLADHQSQDGRWDVDGFERPGEQCGGRGTATNEDVAATALSLLAFLASGHTHESDGPYRQTVKKAVKWLVAQEKNGKGDLRGPGNMYDQGMAAIALAETYGMTHDPYLRPVVERAVAFIISAQSKATGGWRYFPDDPGDTSVFGWQIMALRSAAMAGVPVPREAFDRAAKYLANVGGGENGGLYGYQDKRPSPAMVAEGMFARQLLGHRPAEPMMIESAAFLRKRLPTAKEINLYYWYYGTLALFQHQGESWSAWNKSMREALLPLQDKKSPNDGSWPPQGQWATGGRVVQTAMAALCLEVYYRYLPLYSEFEVAEPALNEKIEAR
jgi:uncharacterized membrane protein YhaH (DUF805 family)